MSEPLTPAEREELMELLDEEIEFQLALDAEHEAANQEREVEDAYYQGLW